MGLKSLQIGTFQRTSWKSPGRSASRTAAVVGEEWRAEEGTRREEWLMRHGAARGGGVTPRHMATRYPSVRGRPAPTLRPESDPAPAGKTGLCQRRLKSDPFWPV